MSKLLRFAAGVAELHERPELREEFVRRVRESGRAAACEWLDKHGAELGLPQGIINAVKAELDRR